MTVTYEYLFIWDTIGLRFIPCDTENWVALRMPIGAVIVVSGVWRHLATLSLYKLFVRANRYLSTTNPEPPRDQYLVSGLLSTIAFAI